MLLRHAVNSLKHTVKVRSALCRVYERHKCSTADVLISYTECRRTANVSSMTVAVHLPVQCSTVGLSLGLFARNSL